MKSKLLPLLVLTMFVCTSQFNFIAGQINSQSDNEFVPNTLLIEGVTLAKKKKFDKAQFKFESSLDYWQVHASGALFLKIIDDYNNKTLKKKTVEKIFKAVNNDFNIKHKKAAKELTKLIKKNQNYYPLYILKGDALANQEMPGEAETAYSAAIRLGSAAIFPYLFRGKYFSKIDEHGKAAADFSKALKLEPASAICLFERGFTFCSDRKYSAAIKDFDAAGISRPEWLKSSIVLEALHNRGVQRMGKKSYRKALADFNRAVQLDPEYANSYLNRGLAYRALKKYSKAIDEFTLCISKQPDFATAYYQRALTHFKRKHFGKAIIDLRKALELRPDEQKFEYKLAECYYKQGKFRLAIVHFNKVLKLNANYFWAYYWKGYSYKYLGKPKPAILAFQKFLNLAPKQHRSQRVYAEAEIRDLKRGK